ncbi:MAG: hypothetical protein II897_03950 [Clostridia bacterium]|nr:hypothetical protein [Clostridia bacterium]
MSQNQNPIPTVFEYNGASYEFDIRDADYAEKFENALETLGNTEKSLSKDGKSSALIRSHCDMLKKFFDDCLGDGAGASLCTEKSNISLCYAAYDAFLIHVGNQKNDIIESKNVFSKYSNREQRRAAAHKKP